MTDLLVRRLEALAQPAHRSLLLDGRIGVERETLRVQPDGALALTPHPRALGATLTHPHITTDYAEPLLEFVTGTHARPEDVLQELDQIHRQAYGALGDELLWNQSMPGVLPSEADIPIAWYGPSHSGMLRHVYRRGLALRYGKTMQCIAGIHYNFSLAEGLWSVLPEGPTGADAQARQSAGYIALIRNFSRYSWLLMYLFGASPALQRGFLRGRPHQLETLDDDTLYLPYATSLRMSDLGYQNKAQSGLRPCYDDLQAYVANLEEAVSQPWPEYERHGVKRDGEWIQLSTHILQIENEYYSSIRPKRVARRGERPLRALRERGIQYVEVRCLDIDPFAPLGVSLETCHFMRAFLLFCALEPSPLLPERGWCSASGENFSRVVSQGRQPGLLLRTMGGDVPLADWATQLLERIDQCAALFDDLEGTQVYRASVAAQQRKVNDPALTPSGRLLAELQGSGRSLVEQTLRDSQAHRDQALAHPLPPEVAARFAQEAEASLREQARLEASDVGSFDDYVAAYHASLDA